jgi:hypothetical protein
MLRFDASSARCEIFTFKEGLLAPMAHDLKIEVGRFSIDVDPDSLSINASFDSSSLRVVCALEGGAPAAALLNADDKQQIEKRLVEDVLEAGRYPEIRYRSTNLVKQGDELRVSGVLVLHGHERPLELVAHAIGGRAVADVALWQPDFGIRPFHAMLGALRIRPDVLVHLSLPWVAGLESPANH